MLRGVGSSIRRTIIKNAPFGLSHYSRMERTIISAWCGPSQLEAGAVSMLLIINGGLIQTFIPLPASGWRHLQELGPSPHRCQPLRSLPCPAPHRPPFWQRWPTSALGLLLIAGLSKRGGLALSADPRLRYLAGFVPAGLATAASPAGGWAICCACWGRP